MHLSLFIPGVVAVIGCVIPEPKDSTGDSGTGDSDTGDSDTGDSGTGDSDTGTGDSDTGTGDSDTGTVVATAEIRFISVMSTPNPSLFDALHVDDQSHVQHSLYETQGTAYMVVPASGETQLMVTDSVTEDVLATMTGVYLTEGGRYSVALLPGGRISLMQDDYSNIPSNHTRIALQNADTSLSTDAWIGYWDGEAYPVDYQLSLSPDEIWTEDLPFASAATRLELLYPSSGNLRVDWNFSAFIQVTPNSLVNVYSYNNGDCSYLSRTCTPMIIGHFADGSTATVEGGVPDWAVEMASVRFMNTVSSAAPTLFEVLNVTTLSQSQETLYETQGSGYREVVATGESQFTMTDSSTGDVLAVETGVSLTPGGYYTVAYMPGGRVSIVEDDYTGIAPNDTRFRIINAAEHDLEGHLADWDGTFYTTTHNYAIASGDVWSADVPMALNVVQMEVYWPGMDGLIVDWNGAAFSQVTPGSLINSYVYYNNDCSYLSNTCTPMVVAIGDDSLYNMLGTYTFSVEYTADGSFGWSP